MGGSQSSMQQSRLLQATTRLTVHLGLPDNSGKPQYLWYTHSMMIHARLNLKSPFGALWKRRATLILMCISRITLTIASCMSVPTVMTQCFMIGCSCASGQTEWHAACGESGQPLQWYVPP